MRSIAAALTAGALCCATPGEAATITLADFDGINLGTTEAPLAISSIGASSCVGLSVGGSASGSALCASDAHNGAGGSAELTFSNVDLSAGNTLSFSLAANSGTDTFDAPGGGIGDQITVTAGGTLLAQFDGVSGSDTFSLAAGVATGPSVVNETFADYIIETAGLNLGVETLVFSFVTTGPEERIGIDAVTLTTTPLPPGILLSLAALGALGAFRRRVIG